MRQGCLQRCEELFDASCIGEFGSGGLGTAAAFATPGLSVLFHQLAAGNGVLLTEQEDGVFLFLD